MPDSQITFTISLVMLALFVVALIGFSIGFAIDNSATMSISDDPDLSSLSTSTQDGFDNFKSDSDSTYQSILETTIAPGSDVPQSAAPFAITPTNIIGVVTNIVYLPYKKIFGSGSSFGIFFTTFITVLSFVIILLVYKTWKGSP